MGMEIGTSKFRAAEQTALAGGKISKEDAEKLGKAAAKEDPAVAKQVLEQDSFDSGARAAFAKAAHVKPKNVPAESKIAGQMVGSAAVLKTLGDPKGYENPLEAVTSARMSGVANAGVVKQGDRYYPVELSKAESGPLTSSGSLSQAIGLTPLDQTNIDGLRQQLKDERASSNADASKLADLQQQLASAIYGLPKDSFKVIGKSSSRVETTVDANGMPQGINIQNGLFNDSPGTMGTHSPAGVGGEGFDPSKPTAITIDAGELEGRKLGHDSIENGKPKHTETFELPSTDSAIGVLHHEATHLEDFHEAKGWVDKWQQATGNTWSTGGDNSGFTMWMMKQKGVSSATQERVTQTVGQYGTDTEAHAHIASAVDAIRNGAPGVAKEQLHDYVTSTKGSSPDPQALNHVLAEATRAFKTMSKGQQKEFLAAIKAANHEVKDSPLKGFDPRKFNLKKDV